MDDLLGGPLGEPRLMALLVAAFGVVALILSGVGLYGVIATGVRVRTHEIGVRVALGATPGRIRETVFASDVDHHRRWRVPWSTRRSGDNAVVAGIALWRTTD